ncbi:hypothetical protein J1TS5_08530 [Paenibacillus macerans]|nr:hypothetical protein J1TS5_08530 [Paenibacillus macerans]
MKKWIAVFLALILFTAPFSNYSYAAFQNGYPTVGIEVTPAGAAQMQTVKVEVTGKADALPKVVWVQSDTDIWAATFDDGTRAETGTFGSGKNAVPLEKRTDFKLDMTNYAPGSMTDTLSNSFSKAYVKELEIEDMEWVDEKSYTPFGAKPSFQPGSITATIGVSTGHPLEYSKHYKYSTRYDGADKFMAEYYIPMLVNYKGYVVEKKKMRVLDNATLAVGQTKEMKAQVATLEYNMSDWNDNWYDVTTASETVWTSDNSAVATVDASGKVTAKSKGTATITAQWKKGPYWLYGAAAITVGTGGDPEGPEDPDGPPGVKCTKPSPERSMAGEDFNPNASAVIKADSRGSERFNVADGIPTSESLYGNVTAKEYLYNYKYNKMAGTCTFTVPVTRDFNLRWVEYVFGVGYKHRSENVTLTYDVKVTKPYAYWAVAEFQLYEIVRATLLNYAFEGGGISILPAGYDPPDFVLAAYSTHIQPPPQIKTIVLRDKDIDGGTKRPDIENDTRERGEMEAEGSKRAPKLYVRNDLLEFAGQTIMNDGWVEGQTEMPGEIPEARIINDNVLYSPDHIIPTSKTNKADQASSGRIYYEIMNGSTDADANKDFPIYGINSVTVHTPVVIYPSVSDDRAHNQKTNPAEGRSAIILDRPFTVEMPNSGQHANYLGYGNRNYLKYIGSKQVRFPFDVYDGTKSAFYSKNTWIEVDKSKESFAFFLPVWVDEGFYDVEFRTIAHNAPSGATDQTNANLDLKHHIAYDTVPVDAIGRVYDFRVTDISDYNWESVFRTEKGGRTPTGASYWVGLNGIDGAARGNTSRFTLPIRPGSHPLYNNAVIKTGYHFKFDLKTKGNMFGAQDQIAITPAFYFIDAKKGTRTPVDLYYHTGSKSYVKIGSPSDKVQRYVVLNERLRNVPAEELTDTALYKYDHDYTFNQVAGIGRSQFVQNFIRKTTKQRTAVGSFSLLRLPEGVRTLIGPKTDLPPSVDPARANAAVQKWYGEYSLPADLYAVAAGTNVAEYGRTHGGLTDKSPIFLKDGYIVVNFNIETVRDGNTDKPHLQYIDAPLMNQWFGLEGFRRSADDPYGRTFALLDGDVVFYHADQSSRGDFRSMVTH